MNAHCLFMNGNTNYNPYPDCGLKTHWSKLKQENPAQNLTHFYNSFLIITRFTVIVWQRISLRSINKFSQRLLDQ